MNESSVARMEGFMSLFWRQVLASGVIVAALLAWWFPAPVLLRTELVDWGRLYESRYASSGSGLGVMGMGKAFIRSVTEPMPLNRFIESRTADQLIIGTDPAWSAVLDSLEVTLVPGGKAVQYVVPDSAPYASLPETSRYLQWRDEKGIRYLEYQFVPAADFESHSIPEEVQFPLRLSWLLLLACGLGATLLGFVAGGKPSLIEGSSAGKGLRWSAVFSLLCGGAVIWPFVYQSFGSGFSFASILMGGLFLIGGLVGMWLFGRQAAMVRRMVAGDCLAHFTYSPEEWTKFAQWDYGEEASDKRAIWLLIFVISLVVGLGFMAVMQDEASVWVFGGLMGFMAVLWLLAWAMPKLTYRRDLKAAGEVYVGQDGIYLNGSVHSWNTWGARLDSVSFKADPLSHIEVVYSYLMVAGRSLYFFRNYVTVRVPVPAGREADGKAVVDKLRVA
jgi:hypothetical protein